MIDDYTLKQMNNLMRTLNSPGLKETLRALEQRKMTGGIGDLSLARDILEQRKLLDAYVEAAKTSQQMSNAILSLGSAARTISDSLFGSPAMSAIEAMAQELVRKNEELSSAFSGIGIDQISQLTEAAKGADWCRQLVELSRTVKGFDLVSFQSHFEPISRMIEATQSSLRLVNWGNFATFDIAPELKDALEFRTAELNRSFDAFAGVMAQQPEIIVAAPSFVAKTPTLAVFTHTEALRLISIAPEEMEEESPEEKIWTEARDDTFSVIEDLLPRISPELMNSWKGGWRTADKRTEDWVRQAAASFRYVVVTILDKAAPKDRVKAEVNPRYLEKGEVVRKSQVAWLCEPLKNETYRKAVLADIESAISIIDVFNEAVHRPLYREIEEAFPRLAVRAAVALRHILELHSNRSKN